MYGVQGIKKETGTSQLTKTHKEDRIVTNLLFNGHVSDVPQELQATHGRRHATSYPQHHKNTTYIVHTQFTGTRTFFRSFLLLKGNQSN